MRWIVLAAMIGLSSPATALPKLDPAKTCEEVARLTGSFDPSVYDQCLVKEQQAYDTIRTLWPLISAQIKARCKEQSSSYDRLATCVKNQIGSLAKQFHFKL